MIVPSRLLESRRILLGVSGSIAAYKSLELLRLFIKAGADVHVVMTEAAKRFITPLSFETLSRNAVLHAGNESWATRHNHIHAAEDAEVLVIAPASANTAAKLAHAVADNLLLQCALAFQGEKLLAPSANTVMLQNPITQENLAALQRTGYTLASTQVKDLACQSTGDGAMAEPVTLFWQTARLLLQSPFWRGRRTIVTGGGTIERIDDVRYLSNFSSGKMASALASALYLRGADTTLIASRHAPELPGGIRLDRVESSAQMAQSLHAAVAAAKQASHDTPPYLFMAAAVSDYVPAQTQTGKFKKSDLGSRWDLTLVQNSDLIAAVNKSGIKTVAFKAETQAQTAVANAKKALHAKGVDAICLNHVGPQKGFNTPTNALTFIRNGEHADLPEQDKLSLALALLEKAAML